MEEVGCHGDNKQTDGEEQGMVIEQQDISR